MAEPRQTAPTPHGVSHPNLQESIPMGHHYLTHAPFVPTRLSRLYLAIEFVVLFLGLPLLLFTQRHALDGVVVPILVLLGLGCAAVLLWDASFDRRRLWNREALVAGLWKRAKIFVPGALLMGLGVAAVKPELLWSFPQQETRIWLLLMVLYPIFSVYPQEVIFRAFLFHRYHALFPSNRLKIAASGLAFGLAHVVFANWVAPIMTTVGGVLFAKTYASTQSTLQATLEHGIWGDFVFTLGLGWYVWSGAIGV